MRFLALLIALVIVMASTPTITAAYTIEPRFVDISGQAIQGQPQWMKRYLPAKERRAPLDAFDDMSGFLRTIDGIQKPRFG